MVGFLGVGLIIAAGIVSGQFTQLWTVIAKGAPGTPYNTPGNTTVVNGDQIKLLFGEIIFVVIAAKLAKTSADAEEVITALLVGLWFVWAMYNSQTLSQWVTKVQPKTGG
jgi:hypothetical protein